MQCLTEFEKRRKGEGIQDLLHIRGLSDKEVLNSSGGTPLTREEFEQAQQRKNSPTWKLLCEILSFRR